VGAGGVVLAMSELLSSLRFPDVCALLVNLDLAGGFFNFVSSARLVEKGTGKSGATDIT
jgi:hypothetical protein